MPSCTRSSLCVLSTSDVTLSLFLPASGTAFWLFPRRPLRSSLAHPRQPLSLSRPPTRAQYFENWCQDENRHGDFFQAVLKAQPQFVNDWESKLWSRFFCLSVYVTMYLNDNQRSAFYESLGLNTMEFNMHVIHQTNRTTATIFPQVIDTYNPEFKTRLDALVVLNNKLAEIKGSGPAQTLAKIPIILPFAGHLLALFLMKPVDSGSVDIPMDTSDAAMVY